jgi:hypothetical protein
MPLERHVPVRADSMEEATERQWTRQDVRWHAESRAWRQP